MSDLQLSTVNSSVLSGRFSADLARDRQSPCAMARIKLAMAAGIHGDVEVERSKIDPTAWQRPRARCHAGLG